MKNSWIICSPLLYFNFKTFKDPNSSSFITFPWVLYHSEDFFVRLLKFLQIKEQEPNLWGEPILHKVWIILSPLLYFNFKSLMDTISSSFIRFQCILNDSGVLFSEPWNVYKWKRWDLISGGNQFCRKSALFGPHPPSLFQF